jgi:hypothetical protein
MISLLIAQVINPQSIPVCVAPEPCPTGRSGQPQVNRPGNIRISQRQSLNELRAAIAQIRDEGWEQIVFTLPEDPNKIIAFCEPHDLLICLVGLPVREYVLTEY